MLISITLPTLKLENKMRTMYNRYLATVVQKKKKRYLATTRPDFPIKTLNKKIRWLGA